MGSLTYQRCFNHGMREAVARCPSCHQFFCRECVTEHEGKVTCAACLSKRSLASSSPSTGRGRALARGLLGLLSVAVCLLFFYCLGQLLLLLPDSVHDGSVWEETAQEIQ